MKGILLYIWQLPQNLIGLCILLWAVSGKRIAHNHVSENSLGTRLIYTRGFPGGISLGHYVFVNSQYEDFNGLAESHEIGHCKQSLYLGWLYLLIIGLPSLLGNIWDRIAHAGWTYSRRYEWYYNQPWEKWADKLGGVKR